MILFNGFVRREQVEAFGRAIREVRMWDAWRNA